MRKYGSAKDAFFKVGIQLFLANGYDALSVSQICNAANASNGSFFHHFGSKGRFAAELYANVLDDYHTATLSSFDDAFGLKEGIASFISSHIQWVIDNKEMATYLHNSPSSEVLALNVDGITELNASYQEKISVWYQRQQEEASSDPIPLDLFYFQVIGPTQMQCRWWLAGRVEADPTVHQERLVELAVKAITG